MSVLLALAAGIFVAGWAFGWSSRVRIGGLAALWAVVVATHLVLPEGHEIRVATGGQVAPWLVLGALAGFVFAYRQMLSWARGRAREEVVRAPELGEPRASPLSAAELTRYSRQIMLRKIGGPGQARLKSARVLVVGAGGLGAAALQYLAAAGVGHLRVVDNDKVALSNLHRQVIHTTERLGQGKALSARAALEALNPEITVEAVAARFDADRTDLVMGCDLVMDATDTSEARHEVNAAAVAAGIPLVSGGISAWDGQVSVYDPAAGGPCYACVAPRGAATAPGCAEAGVFGPLAGVIGAMMAGEALKVLTGAGVPLRGRMMIYDALTGEARGIAVARAPECPVCGGARG